MSLFLWLDYFMWMIKCQPSPAKVDWTILYQQNLQLSATAKERSLLVWSEKRPLNAGDFQLSQYSLLIFLADIQKDSFVNLEMDARFLGLCDATILLQRKRKSTTDSEWRQKVSIYFRAPSSARHLRQLNSQQKDMTVSLIQTGQDAMTQARFARQKTPGASSCQQLSIEQ